MATAAGTPKKTTRASRKTPIHETHGALPAIPNVNLNKLFDINDGYDVDTLPEYEAKLADMVESDLELHAHRVGVVPLKPRSKLEGSLKDKFQRVKASARPGRVLKVQVNPKMADFHKRYMAGDLD